MCQNSNVKKWLSKAPLSAAWISVRPRTIDVVQYLVPLDGRLDAYDSKARVICASPRTAAFAPLLGSTAKWV
jgi:hypothetical protein